MKKRNRHSTERNENYENTESDGITVELYKIFWNDIKTYYIQSLNYSFQTSKTIRTQGKNS